MVVALALAAQAADSPWQAAACGFDADAARERASTDLERGIAELLAPRAGVPELQPMADLLRLEPDVFQATALWNGVRHYAGLVGEPIGDEPPDDGMRALRRWDAPSGVVELPLRWSEHGAPVVEVLLAGRPARFALDTGATVSAVAADHLPAEAALGDRAEFDNHGHTGQARYADVRLEIPGLGSRTATLLVLPAGSLDLHGFDGAIGWQLFGSARVEIDGARSVVRIGPSQPGTPNLVWWSGAALVRGRVLGEPALLWLDTGSGDSVLYASARERGIPVPEGSRRRRRIQTLAGRARQVTEAIPAVAVEFAGASAVLPAPVEVLHADRSWMCIDARIGASLARGGTLIVDGPAGLVEARTAP